jgi:molybdopterin molybdotransferase
MPDGADSVLVQEEAQARGGRIIAPEVRCGRHVRARAIDFRRGQTMLAAGAMLDATAIALTAASGVPELQVAKRPRVTIMSGGDEIVAPGAEARADQIYDSCSYGVEALARIWGAEARRLPLLPDKMELIEAAAAKALADSDLIVFIGSASVGPHDHARAAFERLGARILVSKVDMRPGKPTWFATTPRAPILGLPGNPASALVSSALFLAPLLAKLQGRHATPVLRHARLNHDLPANGPRETYLRARIWTDETGQTLIDANADQDSSLLSVFARSNALLVRGADAEPAPRQSRVEYLAWPHLC